MTAPLGVRLEPEGDSQTVLFVFILVAMLVCAGAMLMAESNVGWISALHKPPSLPIVQVFPSVWTALYVGIAIAGWRVWRVVGLQAVPFALYAGQMAAGLLWFFVFFYHHQLGLALDVRLVQLGLVLLTTISFWRIDLLSGVILLVNLLWWALGAVLNVVLWHLNP